MTLIDPTRFSAVEIPTPDAIGFGRFPDVQPFSARDGLGYQETLEGIYKYITRQLYPYLVATGQQEVWDANVDKLVTAVQAALDAQESANEAALEQTLQEIIAHANVPFNDALVAQALQMVGSTATAFLDGRYRFKNKRNGITGWFHANDYGADFTGATDATPGILAAVAAAKTAGGTVHLPDGQYKLATWKTLNPTASVAIELPSNVTLRGSANAVLNPSSLPTTPVIAVVGSEQAANLSDITVDGISIVDPGQKCIGVMLGAAYGVNGHYPVTRATVKNARFFNCSIGVHVRDGSTGFQIIDNIVIDPKDEGIQAQNCTHGLIARNRVRSATSGGNGIDISGENNGAIDAAGSYITVSQNIVNMTGAGSKGIFFETVAHCSAVDNIIEGGDWAMYHNRINSEPLGNLIANNKFIGGTSGCLIINNNVPNTQVIGNTFHVRGGTVGLDINVSYQFTIQSNQFFGSKVKTGYGIHLRNGSHNGVIGGNLFDYFDTDIVYDSGTFAVSNKGNASTNVTTIKADA